MEQVMTDIRKKDSRASSYTAHKAQVYTQEIILPEGILYNVMDAEDPAYYSAGFAPETSRTDQDGEEKGTDPRADQDGEEKKPAPGTEQGGEEEKPEAGTEQAGEEEKPESRDDRDREDKKPTPHTSGEEGLEHTQSQTIADNRDGAAKEPAISVSDLVIRYRSLASISIKNRLLSRKKNRKNEVFEALHGITFEVNKGEILGIVGKNGSGKSTLLRAIGGIFSPDVGSVDLHGNQVSLLSIGIGFQRMLSGRENIYLNAMLLGFSKEMVEEKMDEIIEFSELGSFIDKPVKTYSSGMYSKLAFSIAVILQTDILLVDEVLSVGDAHFRKKSFAKMKDLITDKDRTVVIVSHSLQTLSQLCTQVLWIHDGDMIELGPTEEVLKRYEDFMNSQ